MAGYLVLCFAHSGFFSDLGSRAEVARARGTYAWRRQTMAVVLTTVLDVLDMERLGRSKNATFEHDTNCHLPFLSIL